jgi:hypothetical protein
MQSLMLCTDDPDGMELYLRNPASFNIPTGGQRPSSTQLAVHPTCLLHVCLRHRTSSPVRLQLCKGKSTLRPQPHGVLHVLHAGVPVSFAEVQEAVRLTRQTAIGYIRGSGGSPAAIKAHKDKQRRQAVLGCSASHRVTFGEADRIVAIALVSPSRLEGSKLM